ncbi:MAG TPA: cupredoxin family copper-binding protein [Longimicrobiales bacterium]
MSWSIRAVRAAAVVLVAIASACTSEHKSPTDVVQTQNVAIAHFAFAPASITVPVGTTVNWTNQDATAHTATSDAAGWDSGSLAQNASFSHTFNTKGTFTYHCSFHASMKATVTVQ